MELGLYTFVEHTPDRHGTLIPREERIANLLEEAVLADQVGLDTFGVGEHHRADYLASAPTMLLAAIAARTSRIKLSTAVTVLSSEDPVRVFQQFATLDLISQGRAEVMAGRGSFIESFPLFGYDLNDYDTLFTEKLDLLLELVRNERVTWKGRHRAPLADQVVYPRPLQEQLPVWIAVGGTPQSVVRAAMHGVPMALAIIGGSPERFVPYAELYRDTWQKAGHDPAKLQLSINSHGFIADTTAQAAETAWHPYALQMGKIGRERGWPPPTKHQFDAERSPKGAVLIGDPQAVIDKILWEHELFGMTRFTLQMSVGSLPHRELMHAIELYGTVVAPAVRKALGSAVPAAAR
ncbi:MAG: LLM class flavin-dependent oxidoreductase [Gemmatimonadaceae bacterium]|nr:LLM class flavin-dependent oxidoreductase [Gemmatimonadaceae bacterium]MCW5826422.1 LLM class flavin-dependent oxidoreductase [Gemmatimonadaceae bacterium]